MLQQSVSLNALKLMRKQTNYNTLQFPASEIFCRLSFINPQQLCNVADAQSLWRRITVACS
jgi:hypothetical protein